MLQKSCGVNNARFLRYAWKFYIMHERVKEVENKRCATRMAEVEPSRPDSGRRVKNNLNFYFHASLWYLKRFYEGLIILQLSKT